MKTLTKILALAVIACLVTSCEDPEDFSYPTATKTAYSFDADFVVSDFSDVPLEPAKGILVAKPILCKMDWVGHGKSTQMGEFTVKMSLLCNKDNLTFCNLIGTFEFTDGSVIFFSIAEGKMECNTGKDSDYYDLTLNNPAVINGGTGRYTGISGSFLPNALIHNAPGSEWNAKFSCKGEIKFLSMTYQRIPAGLIYEP